MSRQVQKKKGNTANDQSWWRSLDPKVQAAIITAIGAVIVAACRLLSDIPQDIVQSPRATTAPSPPMICPHQDSTDAATIIRIIQAEAEAVNSEDISIIQAIFSAGAHIRDESNNEDWHDPVARYETLFSNADYIGALNLAIQPAGSGITGNVAWFTSESQGRCCVDDECASYFREPHESHWTLQKNSSGCWVITEFVFNAPGVPFPP